MKQIAMFNQFRDFQKSQKKAAKKRKHSDDKKCDSDTLYSQSNFKHDVLARKRKKGIPATEIVREATVNGKKQSIIILIDTDSSSNNI
jgi:hypothetical protein